MPSKNQHLMSVTTRSNTARPGQQILETRLRMLRHQSTYHISPRASNKMFPKPWSSSSHVYPSGVFFARHWSKSTHLTPSPLSKFLLLESISLSKAPWASWCNPLHRLVHSFSLDPNKVLKHVSKVLKYRLLTTYYFYVKPEQFRMRSAEAF